MKTEINQAAWGCGERTRGHTRDWWRVFDTLVFEKVLVKTIKINSNFAMLLKREQKKEETEGRMEGKKEWRKG